MQRRKSVVFSTVLLAGALSIFASVTVGVLSQVPAAAAGSATQLAFTAQPTPNSVVPGGSFGVAVSVEDSSGNVVTTDNTDQVLLGFGYNPGGAVLTCGAGGTTQTVSAGVANFSCSTTTAFVFDLQATNPNGSLSAAVPSSYLTVNPGPAAALSFTTQPINASSGAPFPVQVSVEDSYGNVVSTDNTDLVTLAVTQGAALSCTPGFAVGTPPSDTATVSGGVAYFTCSVTTAGTGYTLNATTSGGLYTASSTSFDIGQESAAPTSVVAASLSGGRAEVTWLAPASDGGVSISTYVVQYSSNEGTSWSTATCQVTGTSCVVTGLTNGTSYVFEVAATNAAGTGPYSALSSPVTPAGVAVVKLVSKKIALASTAAVLPIRIACRQASCNGVLTVTARVTVKVKHGRAIGSRVETITLGSVKFNLSSDSVTSVLLHLTGATESFLDGHLDQPLILGRVYNSGMTHEQRTYIGSVNLLVGRRIQ